MFAITSVFSWQSSISLCSASFGTPRPNLPVTPCVSWLPFQGLAFQSPIMKKTSFLSVSSRRQPTPVFMPGKSHGPRSLVGYSPWGRKELDTTERLHFHFLGGLVDLHRTVQLLHHYWLGHRLGSPWYWMVCLGNEQRSFCRFWDCIQVVHFRLFCWLWWLLHFFWGIPARSSRYNGHLS